MCPKFQELTPTIFNQFEYFGASAIDNMDSNNSNSKTIEGNFILIAVDGDVL